MKPTMLLATLCALLALPSQAMAQQVRADDPAFADIQKHFAEAYNRGDVDAMASAFAENGVRVTPSGIFQGRQAIRRSLEIALKLGLHDYSVVRTISRSEGSFIFNAGEWQATIGDRQFHGYYSAILVRDGGEAKIMEETVNVAAP